MDAPIAISPDWQRTIVDEPVPCGTCRTTRYVDARGNLMRQDIEIIVDMTKFPELIRSQVGG